MSNIEGEYGYILIELLSLVYRKDKTHICRKLHKGKCAKKVKIIYKTLYQSMQTLHLPGKQNTDCHI